MLGWEKAPMMIVTHEEVWYEDRKREKERGRGRETERNLCNEDILTFFTPPGLHTSGTEWSMADRRRPVDILEKKYIYLSKKRKQTSMSLSVSQSHEKSIFSLGSSKVAFTPVSLDHEIKWYTVAFNFLSSCSHWLITNGPMNLSVAVKFWWLEAALYCTVREVASIDMPEPGIGHFSTWSAVMVTDRSV